jgi:acetate kinase
MAASLNGIDALVFTAGIGEHSPEIRTEICAHLGFLGLTVDDTENHMVSTKDRIISSPTSSGQILVVHAEESWMIAQECRRLIEAPG